MKTSRPQGTNRLGDRLRSLQNAAFSCNLVSAFGYAALIYVFKSPISSNPESDASYYFRRAAVRVNDFVNLPMANAVTTNAVARQNEGAWGQVGEELTVLVSTVTATLILSLLLRTIVKSSRYRRSLDRLALLTALFAAPACYLFVSKVTWGWKPEGVQPQPLPSFWKSPLLLVFAAEILCAGVLWLVHRARPVSSLKMGATIVIHFGFWLPALWTGLPGWFHRLFVPYLLLTAFPVSGFVAWLCLKCPPPGAAGTERRGRAVIWNLAGVVLSLAALTAVWFPGRAYNLARPREFQSAIVEVSRGECYGMCPKYRIVIHGNGLVQYFGERYVRIHGQQTALLSRERVTEILRVLDRLRFFTIEDRAFQWGFDTPSVSVSVSVDGNTKRVVSDESFTGVPSGVQSQFVQSARQIETIAGSDRWARCPGRCRK